MKQNKQTVKMNESQLRNIIKESIKNVLKETAEGKIGATYVLTDNVDGKTWSVPVFVNNQKELDYLNNLCFGGGIRRFNGLEEIYCDGKCDVPEIGKTLSVKEFSDMFKKGVLKESIFQGANRLQQVYDKLQDTRNLVLAIHDNSNYGSQESKVLSDLYDKIGSVMVNCRKSAEIIGVKINY